MDQQAKSFFRPDIEGLRAVAVLLVLVFHTGVPLPGGFIGVDLFFVISGFLITSLLLREVAETGRVSLVGFYARRAKRLLPAASIVLIGTMLATRILAPSANRSTFLWDIVASASYVVNWRFAARSVDYLAEDVGRSPVLHFWSLSVEEQFYFVWPVLILVSVVVARRLRTSQSRAIATALCLVVVPSLVFAVAFGSGRASEAFFVTTTRFWELGIGAILALLLPRLERWPERVGTPLTWLGSALVALSACVVSRQSSWPGYLALAPTLGAALVIAGGAIDRRGPVSRALSSRPMVWIGGLSYSIYLWHWPFVVIGQDWYGLKGPAWGAALVFASVLPAWLTFRFVETPIRFGRAFAAAPPLVLSLGINATLGCVVIGLLGIFTLDREKPAALAETIRLTTRAGRVVATPASLGAGAFEQAKNGTRPPGKRILPSPLLAPQDVPRAYGDGCQVKFEGVKPKWCKMGAPQGKKEVVLLGDSKILQYSEALDAIGKARGWRIRTATKSSCAFTSAMTVRASAPYAECRQFYDVVMKQLKDNPPDLVITSQQGSFALPTGGGPANEAAMIAGLVEAWRLLRSWGTEVVVILDNPNASGNPNLYQCVADHTDQLQTCEFSRAESKSAAQVQAEAASRVPGVHVVDLVDRICPASSCVPVIGEVLIYRQGSHITNTYVRTLAPILDERLRTVLAP